MCTGTRRGSCFPKHLIDDPVWQWQSRIPAAVWSPDPLETNLSCNNTHFMIFMTNSLYSIPMSSQKKFFLKRKLYLRSQRRSECRAACRISPFLPQSAGLIHESEPWWWRTVLDAPPRPRPLFWSQPRSAWAGKWSTPEEEWGMQRSYLQPINQSIKQSNDQSSDQLVNDQSIKRTMHESMDQSIDQESKVSGIVNYNWNDRQLRVAKNHIPLPVSATPMTSRFCSPMGMACRWMGVGES